MNTIRKRLDLSMANATAPAAAFLLQLLINAAGPAETNPYPRQDSMGLRMKFMIGLAILFSCSSFALACVKAGERVNQQLKEAGLTFERSDSFDEIYKDPRYKKIILMPAEVYESVLCIVSAGNLTPAEATALVVLMQRLPDKKYREFVSVVFDAERDGKLPKGTVSSAVSPPEAFAAIAIRRHKQRDLQRVYDMQTAKSGGNELFYAWLTSGRCIYNSAIWFEEAKVDRICNGKLESKLNYGLLQ